MTYSDQLHNADDSYVGYLYQGQYALLLLQEATPDASASVETADDVVLEGPQPTLYQLKHSLVERPPSLTLRNAGWWNTLGIWATHPLRASATFAFVTCATIQVGSPLEGLRADSEMVDLEALATALLAEARRVMEDRAAARTTQPPKPPPHEKRAHGCEAVLALSRTDLLSLLARITILDGAVRAPGVEEELARRLQGTFPVRFCAPVASRLLEWWDRQVTLALLGKRDRAIRKEEYAARLHALILEQGEDRLPDDYSDTTPTEEELQGELRTTMERQIHLVGGGPHRLLRAACARWQARNQRHRWLEDDLGLVPLLDQYDRRLIHEWADRHGPMIDDTADLDEPDRKKAGLELLDWAHKQAPLQVVPPRPTWQQPFLARGQLQELAERLKVGWHPQYAKHLVGSEEEDQS